MNGVGGVVRSLLLAAGSLALFVGAYALTGVVLPDPDRPAGGGGGDAGPLPRPRPTLPGEGIGPSDDVSFRLFDPRTDRPVAQVRVGSYRRTADREVTLGGVTISIAAEGGGVLVVTSPAGRIRVDPPAAGGAAPVDVGSLAAADRARLSDVTVAWYDDQEDLARGRPASLTARVDNLVFDYDRLTLETADTTIGDRTVLADDVPVVVRGPKYDFDGRGLLVEWDPDAGRPALVRVRRGGRLVIKQAPAFAPAGAASAGVRPMLLASADGLPAVPGSDAVPYAASVAGGVTAVRAGETVLTADAATATFALAPAGADELRAGPVADPAPRRGRRSERPADPAPPPPEEEAEAFEPVVVTWAGEFRLEPARAGVTLAGPDDARLRLVGSPVVARLDGREARAAEVRYARSADAVELVAARGGTVMLDDPAGGRLVAPRFVVERAADRATAEGAGVATLIEGGDETRLRWGGRCVFRFDSDAEGEAEGAALRHVDATGGVAVSADGLDLEAAALGLDLEPAAGGPEVRRVEARGGVRCVVAGDDGPTRFTADALALDLPDGADGPVSIEAAGDVEVRRADGRVSGDRLAAVADGEELRDVVVSGDVTAADADGRVLAGDRAALAGPGRPLVVSGTPATAAFGGATIAGETLVLDPDAESLGVPAAGTLTAAGDDGSATTLRWRGDLTAADGRADVTGGLTLETTSDDLTATAEAGSATLFFDEEGDAAEELDRVKLVRLDGGVRVDAADGGGRDVALRAASAEVEPAAEAFRVPVPGRFLFRDNRPDGEGFRGEAAFEWKGRLDFDPESNRLTLAGGATAAVDPREGPAFRLTADRFEVDATEAGGRRELGSAAARGGAVFAGEDVRFEAGLIAYDPAAGTLTAGGDGSAVRVFDAGGAFRGQFDRAVYAVGAGEIRQLEGLRAGG